MPPRASSPVVHCTQTSIFCSLASLSLRSMIRCTLALFLCAFLFPVPAFASADFDYLMGDVQKFEEDVRRVLDAQSAADAEHGEQRLDALFPSEERREENGNLAEVSFGSSVTVQVDGVPVTFTDVAGDVWFAPYVRDMAGRGIVSGYRGADGRPLGLFGPRDNVTVEQLAKMVIEATGHVLLDCAKGTLRNESARGSWSEEYIRCAEYLGWAVYSDGSVDAMRPATRSEVVVTVLQAFEVLFGRATGAVFSDVTSSTEFSGAIERAASDSIVSGYADAGGVPTGAFGPSDPVNRAAMAKILSLALQVYGGK